MPKKRLNDLDGKTWFKFSFSIWRDIRRTSEEIKLKHPAMFPLALTSRIINIFTTKGDVVLDPFMGYGSTIISAAIENRKGIGFDIKKEYCEVTKRRLKDLKLRLFTTDFIKPEVYNKDARNVLNCLSPSSIDLCITSPPYWDILNQQRTADKKQNVSYSDLSEDLGNISDYGEFLVELKSIFDNVYKSLKPNGYCVVVVMDLRKKSKFFPFHSDLADNMQEIGFSFEDTIIWDRQHEYNKMRPLGYPYAFRVNKVHEYILIFKKEKQNE